MLCNVMQYYNILEYIFILLNIISRIYFLCTTYLQNYYFYFIKFAKNFTVNNLIKHECLSEKVIFANRLVLREVEYLSLQLHYQVLCIRLKI